MQWHRRESTMTPCPDWATFPAIMRNCGRMASQPGSRDGIRIGRSWTGAATGSPLPCSIPAAARVTGSPILARAAMLFSSCCLVWREPAWCWYRSSGVWRRRKSARSWAMPGPRCSLPGRINWIGWPNAARACRASSRWRRGRATGRSLPAGAIAARARRPPPMPSIRAMSHCNSIHRGRLASPRG